MSDPMITLWARQPATAAAIDHAALMQRARRLRRRTQLRDAAEYSAAALVAAVFVWAALATDDTFVRIAHVVIVAGVAVVCRNLWVRRVAAPDAADGTPGTDYYRAQLVRQRDALASVARWYLGPIVPGMVLLLIAVGRRMAQAGRGSEALVTLLPMAAAMAGVFGVILWLNNRAAARVTNEIAALDRELADVGNEGDEA